MPYTPLSQRKTAVEKGYSLETPVTPEAKPKYSLNPIIPEQPTDTYKPTPFVPQKIVRPEQPGFAERLKQTMGIKDDSGLGVAYNTITGMPKAALDLVSAPFVSSQPETPVRPPTKVEKTIKNIIKTSFFPTYLEEYGSKAATEIGKAIYANPVTEPISVGLKRGVTLPSILSNTPEAFIKRGTDILKGGGTGKDLIDYYSEAVAKTSKLQKDPANNIGQNILWGLADAIPQTAVGVVLSLVPYGKVIAPVYWGAISSGGQIEEKGTVTSGKNLLIDTVGDSMLGGAIESLLKKPAAILGKAGFRTAKKAAVGFVTEGGTEVAQSMLKYASNYKDAKTAKEKLAVLEETKNYVVNGGMLLEFLVGGIAGAGITAGATLMPIRMNVNVDNINLPTPPEFTTGITRDKDPFATKEQMLYRNAFRDDVMISLKRNNGDVEDTAGNISFETGINKNIVKKMVQEIVNDKTPVEVPKTTPIEIPETLYRGTAPMGRPEGGKIYVAGIPDGSGDPMAVTNVLGEALYMAPDRTTAERFAGKEGRITEYTNPLKNPLVLEKDADLWNLKTQIYKKTGSFPDPLDPMLDQRFGAAPGAVALTAEKLQQAIKDLGYDGVIVNLSGKKGGVEELTKYFQDSQVVSFVPAIPKGPGVKPGAKISTSDIALSKEKPIIQRADIQLKRDVAVVTMSGEKVTIPKGEVLSVYEQGGKVLLKDGREYIVDKNQFKNIINNSFVSSEGVPFAPELKEVTTATLGGKESDERAKKYSEITREIDKLDDDFYVLQTSIMKPTQDKYDYYSHIASSYNRIMTRAEERAYKKYEDLMIGSWDKVIVKSKRYPKLLEIEDKKKVLYAERHKYSPPVGEYNRSDPKYPEQTEKGGKENYREILVVAPKKYTEMFQDFVSGHYPRLANIFFHTRIDNRTFTIDGKEYTVTFGEENQSDWMLRIRQVAKNKARDEGLTGEALKIRANQLVNLRLEELPFLRDWLIQSIKVDLFEAVKDGSDYYAWTNGQQQKDRYKLSFYLEAVSWELDTNQSKKLKLQEKGTKRDMYLLIDKYGIVKEAPQSKWIGEDLSNIIGGEITDKILDADKEGTIEGEGLDLGGKWADNLYNIQKKNIIEQLTGNKIEYIDMGIKAKSVKEYDFFSLNQNNKSRLTGSLQIKDLKVGEIICDIKTDTNYIITNVLEDGKFKFVPESISHYEPVSLIEAYRKKDWNDPHINTRKQTFNIQEEQPKVLQPALKMTKEVISIIKGESPVINKPSGLQIVNLRDVAAGRTESIPEVIISKEEEKIPVQSPDFKKLGPGHRQFSEHLEIMVRHQTLFPEDKIILEAIFENTNDNYLRSLNLQESDRMKAALGKFTARRYYGQDYFDVPSSSLRMRTGLALFDPFYGDVPSKVFTHEFGHSGYYLLMTEAERNMVEGIWASMPRKERTKFFQRGMTVGRDPSHYTGTAREFFAESFAQYVFENKVPVEKMRGLLRRIAKQFFDRIKTLVYRGEERAVNRLKPFFEKILTGTRTPVSEFSTLEPPSFKQELQRMIGEEETKAPKKVPLIPKLLVPEGDTSLPFYPEEQIPTPPEPIEYAQQEAPTPPEAPFPTKLSEEGIPLALNKREQLIVQKRDQRIEELKKKMDIDPGEETSLLKQAEAEGLFDPRIPQEKEELLRLIAERQLRKTENVRMAEGFPVLGEMTFAQINEFKNILSQYPQESEFLTARQLQTIHRTNLVGLRTVEEVQSRLRALRGLRPGVALSSKPHRFMYDTQLSRQDPFWGLVLDTYNVLYIESASRAIEIQAESDRLINEARKSRKGGFLSRLIPQDTLILDYLSASLDDKIEIVAKMTPEEFKAARFQEDYYKEIYNWKLLEQLENKFTSSTEDEISRFKDVYFHHTGRPFFEAWKQSGFIEAMKESVKDYENAQKSLNILNERTGDILPYEKWIGAFQFRSGKMTPSSNAALSFNSYVDSIEKAKLFNEAIPELMIYAHVLGDRLKTATGLETDVSLQQGLRQWINTKKGRVERFGVDPGSKEDWILRRLISILRVRDLALNIGIQVASPMGEQAANLIMLRTKWFIGMRRLLTRKGTRIGNKYENFVGRNVIDLLKMPSKDIGQKLLDLAMLGFGNATRSANKVFLLGSMTRKEYEDETISSERLAKLRLDMGRFRNVQGSESIVGKSAEAIAFTQYKKWAIPGLTSVANDINVLLKMIGGKTVGEQNRIMKSKEFKELLMIALMGAAFLLTLNPYYKSLEKKKSKRTFAENVTYKSLRDSLSMFSALSSSFIISFAAPRVTTFLVDLLKNVTSIVTMEKYISGGKEGQTKGEDDLAKTLLPVAISQFTSGGEVSKKTGKGGGLLKNSSSKYNINLKSSSSYKLR